jgi:hypothetical protein
MKRATTLTRKVGTRELTVRIRPQLPLVDDLGDATSYVMQDHAIERCEERGIGIMEVYSVIADPHRTSNGRATKDGESRRLVRGDLEVVVNPSTKKIVTVVDLDEESRVVARTPLNPLIPKGAKVPPRQKAVGKASTLDEAWCLVVHKDEDMRKVFITPELAHKLLELNHHNRALRRPDVDAWKQKLREGEFRCTHQGVAIDSKGSLQDGQHRLTAIEEEGIGTFMWVAVGTEPENFDVIDTGRNRSYGDVLHLSGETNVFVLGATVRLIHLYLTRDYAGWGKGKISNHVVMEAFRKDPAGYREAIRMGYVIGQGIPLTKTAGGAAFYVINRVNKKPNVDEFFEGLITGADIGRSDPRLVLRRSLERKARDRERAFGAEHLALTVKTWNAWVEGVDMKTVSWKRNEDMPRVTRLER